MSNRKKMWLFFVLVFFVGSLHLHAKTVNTRILLPDGNGAPYATVSIGTETFTADATGNVVLEVPEDKSVATVTWLTLSQELAISEKMKFKNKVLYGAPYSKDDFDFKGPDVWEFSDNEIIASAGSESQIFYDDSFENTILRAIFKIDNVQQYYYLRFFTRLVEPGFNGYCLSFPTAGQAYVARYEGNWDKHSDIGPTFLAYSTKPKIEYEFVLFSKDEKLVGYIRETSQKEYKKILDLEDKSDGVFFDGGFAIMSSFVSAKITELGLFSY